MNQEIKARWVAALRDGRPQTVGVLERVKAEPSGIPAGQCCLGVLCSIAAEDGIIKRVKASDEGIVGYADANGNVEIEALPYVVKQWAGLLENSPRLPVSRWALADLNDDEATFAEIADLIEREF